IKTLPPQSIVDDEVRGSASTIQFRQKLKDLKSTRTASRKMDAEIANLTRRPAPSRTRRLIAPPAVARSRRRRCRIRMAPDVICGCRCASKAQSSTKAEGGRLMSVQVPASAIYTFTDPDDYTTSFRGSEAQLTIAARGSFSARLTWVRLHSLQMQRFSDNLPRVLRAAHVHRRATISFITGRPQVWTGAELDSAQLTLHNLDQDHFQ